MRIEPATSGDVDALVDAWADLAETQREYGSHLDSEANREAIRPILAYHVVSGTCLVARVDETDEVEGAAGSDGRPADGIVGFVNYGLEEAGLEGDATRGVIHNVYVDPGFRGAGVGSSLLSAAEADLVERGADVVAIEALADNEAARRLYRRRGYALHRVQYERVTESDTNSKEED